MSLFGHANCLSALARHPDDRVAEMGEALLQVARDDALVLHHQNGQARRRPDEALGGGLTLVRFVYGGQHILLKGR
jgi:hypothetical protein